MGGGGTFSPSKKSTLSMGSSMGYSKWLAMASNGGFLKADSFRVRRLEVLTIDCSTSSLVTADLYQPLGWSKSQSKPGKLKEFGKSQASIGAALYILKACFWGSTIVTPGFDSICFSRHSFPQRGAKGGVRTPGRA